MMPSNQVRLEQHKQNAPQTSSILCQLREERKLSQRTLAQKMGVLRSCVRRLERTPWNELSLGELQLLAKGLEMRIEDLIRCAGIQENKEIFIRGSLEKPFSVIRFSEGVQMGALIKNADQCFIGTLKLDPQKSLTREQMPKGQLVYWLVLKGSLQVSVFSKDYLFKEGECFYFEEQAEYEIYNPHQFRNAEAALFTLPSFMRMRFS